MEKSRMEYRTIPDRLSWRWIYFLGLLIPFFMINSTKAQLHNWTQDFTGSDGQYSNTVTTDYLGNIIIAGSYSSNSIDFDENASPDVFNFTNSGTEDVFVAKFSPTGNLLWARNIGGLSDEYVYGVAVSNGGNVYVVGEFYSSAIDVDGDYVTDVNAYGNGDMFLVRFLENGNFSWARRMGSTLYSDAGYGVDVDGSEFIYVTGYFEGTANFDGAGNLTSYGSTDIFLARYNNAGGLNWAFQLGGTDTDIGIDIVLDEAKTQAHITGFASGSFDLDGDGFTDYTSVGFADAFVTKFFINTSLLASVTNQWFFGFGGTGDDVGMSLSTDAFDNVAVSGFWDTDIDLDGDAFTDATDQGSGDAFINVLDINGVHQWGTTIGSANFDSGNSVAYDSKDYLTVFGDYGDDMFLAKYDPDGNLLRNRILGGPSFDYGNAVTVDLNGDIIITGEFESSGIDFSNEGVDDVTLQGVSDIFLTKYYGSLNGTYQIDPVGEISDFSTAAELLEADGISGPVTFNVVTGTYNEQVYLGNIFRYAPGDIVTFQSLTGVTDDVVLTFDGSATPTPSTLELDGPSYLEFKSLTIETQSSTLPYAVELYGSPSATNVRFINSRISGPLLSSGDGIIDGILFYAEQYDNLEILGNEFLNGDAGVRLDNVRSTVSFNDNIVQDQAEWGVALTNSASLTTLNVYDNRISTNLTGYQWGFQESDSYASTDFQIQRNRINLNEGTGFIAGSGSAVAAPSTIVNNFITTGNGTGLELTSMDNHFFYHNSILVGKSDGTGSGSTVYSAPGSNLILTARNNIFANFADGLVYELFYNSLSSDIDYNNLYTTGTVLANDNGSQLATIIDITSEPNSISVFPEFISDTDLHTNNIDLQAGISLASVPNDIDNQPRNAVPFIGADEADLYVGLVGYYPLDDDFLDYSGNTLDLTPSGAPVATADKNGNTLSAMSFDGTDDYATQSDPTAFDITEFTISFWFSTNTSGTAQTLISKGAVGNNQVNYLIQIGSDNFLRASYNNAVGTFFTVTSSETIQTNRWYHVTVVLDLGSGDLYLFLNGNLDNFLSVTDPPASNTTDQMLLGSNHDGSYNLVNYLNGNLDEVRIYNNPLSFSAITEGYYLNLESMSGTYTIGSNAPINLGDYRTFNEAVVDLADRGIDGDVIFNVESNTYNEQVYIPSISGSELGNSITFQSEALDNTQVTLTYNANLTDNYTLSLDGIQNMVIREMTLEATNTGAGTVVEIIEPSNNITFENNRFIGVTAGSTDDFNALVRRNWSGTDTYDDNVLFAGNEFQNGSYGLYYEECTNITIRNNTFTNQEWTGIELIFTPNLILEDNIVSTSQTLITDGIYIESGYDVLGNYGNPVIQRNQVTIPGSNNTYGMYIADFFSEPGTGTLVNNFVHVDATGSGVVGLYIDGLSWFNIFHNSVNISGTDATSQTVFVDNSNDLTFTNNIFSNQSGGLALKTGGGNSNIVSSYNNLFTTGTVLVNQNGTNYADLTAWQTQATIESNSISIQPQFISNSDLHTFNVDLVKGTPLASVTTDFDQDTRSDVVATIGADEVDAIASDSTALVAFYNAMGGNNWTDNTNWLSGTVDTWFGVTLFNNRVTNLELPDNNLIGTIPPEIGDLTALASLQILDDSITGPIPSELWTLNNLTNLTLRNSHIDGTIPPDIGNLTKLVGLDMAFNNLTDTLPDALGNLTNLQTIILDFNDFNGAFPDTLRNLSDLRVLYLGDNNLTGAIPPEFASLDSLALLSLFNNNFSDLPDLSGLTKLNDLHTENNQFTFEDLEPNIGVTNFSYVPQDSVGIEQYDTLDIGAPLTLSITVGGNSNQYQWYFNGSPISGATSSTYTDDQVLSDEFGDYYCEITNTVVTGLTLNSRLFHIANSGFSQVPDLFIVNTLVNPETVYLGFSSSIEFDVTNLGPVDMSGSSSVNVLLSRDSLVSSDDSLLFSATYSNLTVDSLYLVDSIYIFSPDYTAGTYVLLIQADPDNTIAESDESNNVYAHQIVLLAPDKPDYVIESANASPDPINSNESFDITVTMANRGAVAGGASSTTSIRISADEFLDDESTDPEIAGQAVDGLPVDSVATFTIQGASVPSGFESGDFNLFILADNFMEVDELIESNNTFILPVRIANLDVTSPTLGEIIIAPVFPADATSTNITVNVTDDQGVGEVLFIHKMILDKSDQWIEEIMDGTGPDYTFSIPSSYYDEMGLKYYIKALDNSGNSDSSSISYHYKSIGTGTAITGLKTGNTQADYQIIAVPYDFSNNSVSAIFFDDLGGSYDKEQWRLYGFNGTNPVEASGSTPINRGDGYWFIKNINANISLPEATTPDNNDGNPFVLQLDDGWNLIGNPFPFPISWSEVQAANSDVNFGGLRTWNGNGYSRPDVLNVYEGAFVNANPGGAITIPVSKANARIARYNRYEDFERSIDAENWLLELKLESSILNNDFGGLGMHSDAVEEVDIYDDFTIPSLFTYLDLNHTGLSKYGSPVTKSIVSSTENHVWSFTIETNIENEWIRLSWENSEFRDNQSSLILADVEKGVRIDMKNEDHYEFIAKGSKAFRIFYSRNPINENQLLRDPYPNPFNNMLRIPLQVSDTENASLYSIDILSLSGRIIKELFKGNLTKGYHEIVWDGHNDRQTEVARGIYLLRIETGNKNGNSNTFYRKIIKK